MTTIVLTHPATDLQPASTQELATPEPEPITYRVNNPWRYGIFTGAALFLASLGVGAVDVLLLNAATGVGMGALTLLVVSAGKHDRWVPPARAFTTKNRI